MNQELIDKVRIHSIKYHNVKLEEIQENFKNAYHTFPQAQTTFRLNKSVIVGDVGYILWQAKTPALDLTYASDTFIIREGKIISQTYAGVARTLK